MRGGCWQAILELSPSPPKRPIAAVGRGLHVQCLGVSAERVSTWDGKREYSLVKKGLIAQRRPLERSGRTRWASLPSPSCWSRASSASCGTRLPGWFGWTTLGAQGEENGIAIPVPDPTVLKPSQVFSGIAVEKFIMHPRDRLAAV